jgi:isochorismate synthase
MLRPPHAANRPDTAAMPQLLGPKLCRLGVPLPAHDPWLLSANLGRQHPAMGAAVAHWHDGASGLTFSAHGILWGQTLPERQALAVGASAAKLWLEDTIDRGDMPLADCPALLVAQAFEDAPCGRSGPFVAMAGGQILIPKLWLFRWHKAGEPPAHWAVLQAWVQNDGDVQACETTLMQRASTLQRVAQTCSGQKAKFSDTPLKVPPEHATHASAQAFMRQVDKASATVRAGRLEKVVLARTRQLLTPIDRDATLWALREAQPHCVTFALTTLANQTFLGATPETLARLTGGILHTEALAGTTPREDEPHQDAQAAASLLRSSKDGQEHALVVQAISAALKPWAEGAVEVGVTHPLALKHMWHLHTPVWAHVKKGTTLWTLLAALHPTPALGGAPKKDALAYLFAHETWRRGLYAAPLGWVTPTGDGVAVVGIRSLVTDAQKTTLFAGAGIVGQSEAQAEWQETRLKLAVAASALRPITP